MATYNEMLDRLDTMLSDANDRTYTSSEKQEFLNSAYNDPSVFEIVRDDSITTTASDPSYSVPATMDEVLDVMIDIYGDGYPQRVTRNSYQIIGGTLYFDYSQKALLGDKTLVLIGKNKITTADDLPSFLQEYVLHVASIYALEFLKNKFAGRFLKNDVSMTELIAAINTHRQRAAELKKNLANIYEIAG